MTSLSSTSITASQTPAIPRGRVALVALWLTQFALAAMFVFAGGLKLTGAPDMGAIPRFPQPLRWLAGIRTTAVNRPIQAVIQDKKLTFAPIAAKTGSVFRQNPGLFAADKFHPNSEGYQLWTPVINAALDEALQNQPSHCRSET